MEIGEAVAVPVPETSAPDAKALRVSFGEHSARCGDEIDLWAATDNIDDGESVSLKVMQSGSAVLTQDVSLHAGSANHPWVSQAKGSDKSSEPPFDLQGSASGLTATDAEQLLLERYADRSTSTQTFLCKSGPYQWTGKFDIALKSGEVIVTTRIKLVNYLGTKPASASDPLPQVGPAVDAVFKAEAKADIEEKLSGKHFLHRQRCKRAKDCSCPRDRACCAITVRVVVEFVESNEQHLVSLFEGSGRANAAQWTRVKTRANSWAHETGHLLGWYDEYASGAVGAPPRWKVQGGVVMDVGTEVPHEYYWDFRDWLAAITGEPWDVVKI